MSSRVFSFGILATTAFTLSAQVALAAPFTNGCFEAGTTGDVPTGTATGWTLTGNINVQEYTETPPTNTNNYVGTTEGLRALGFNGGQTTPNGVASQTFDTTPGTTYSVTFDFGLYGDYNPGGIVGQLDVGVTGLGTLYGPTTFSDPNGSPYDLSSPALKLSPTFTFVADSTSATLSFTDTSTGSFAVDVGLDNVRVAPVPEPASAAVMGIASAMLLVRRRRLAK